MGCKYSQESTQSKALQRQEILQHIIIDFFHVKLDGHEIVMSESPLKIMYKLLGSEHITSDALTINESPLSRVN